MKAAKVLAGSALGLIAIIAFVAYFLLGNLDDIIKGVVEQVGSEVTGTSVSLDSVRLDLKTGKGQLTGLTIANPPGYNSEYAFRLEDIVVAISPASLSGPVIVISQVKIDGAALIAEQKGTTTNLSELLDNIEKSSKQDSGKPDTKEPPAASDDVRLMIENFAFINTTATVLVEGQGEKSLQVPDVRRKNIGDKTTGLTPQQLSEKILRSVVRAVEKAAKNYLADLAAEAIEKKLTEKLSDDEKSAVDGLKSLFKKK